jgi:FkbM family methyltransferase
MLFNSQKFKAYLDACKIQISGILHVGAHLCEEIPVYRSWGVQDSNVVWVEANPDLVKLNISKGIQCLEAALDETEGTATFNITNNSVSSSLLPLGTHAESYPQIQYTRTLTVQTKTLPTFFRENSLDPKKYNVWNFDVQGVELRILRGAVELLKNVDVIYTEVSTVDLYKGYGKLEDLDTFLVENGFKRVALTLNAHNWGEAIYITQRLAVEQYALLLVPDTKVSSRMESFSSQIRFGLRKFRNHTAKPPY